MLCSCKKLTAWQLLVSPTSDEITVVLTLSWECIKGSTSRNTFGHGNSGVIPHLKWRLTCKEKGRKRWLKYLGITTKENPSIGKMSKTGIMQLSLRTSKSSVFKNCRIVSSSVLALTSLIATWRLSESCAKTTFPWRVGHKSQPVRPSTCYDPNIPGPHLLGEECWCSGHSEHKGNWQPTPLQEREMEM